MKAKFAVIIVLALAVAALLCYGANKIAEAVAKQQAQKIQTVEQDYSIEIRP